MAETADLLSTEAQKVILPNITAGCSMADMAQIEDVKDCWDDLNEIVSGESKIIPITYMNSTAAIKSLCGENGGIVCTSSNADSAFDWAYEKGDKILFLPDQHLGRNTAIKKGLSTDEMIVWNPFKPLGGHSKKEISDAKLILWQGHCSVHTRFTVQQIEKARSDNSNINIIVHPECTQDVVMEADFSGSTEYIKKMVTESDAGTQWAIGTEISMVNRLATENPDKTIFCLDSVVCPCSTMYRIHPAYLSWVLDGLLEGIVVNQIKVDEQTRKYSRIALERMLSLA
jgi:quinolinate synthase